jgi:hypothetical protein
VVKAKSQRAAPSHETKTHAKNKCPKLFKHNNPYESSHTRPPNCQSCQS